MNLHPALKLRLPSAPGYYEPEVEAIYRFRQNERALMGTRVLLLSAAFALVVFSIWDRFIDPASLSHTLPVRALGAAIILLLWGGTHYSPLQSRLSWFLFGNTVTCTAIVAWVLVIVPDGLFRGLPNFFFVPLSFSFLPNFRAVALNCIAVLIIVNAVQLVDVTPHDAAINTNIFLSAMCAVTGLFAWVNEARNREVFDLEIELERLATTDPLTGTFNRRHFTQCAENEIARSVRKGYTLTLMMLDIDHFKSINDTHGHHTGDVALCQFAETCRRGLRRSDTLGRMGGEEFAVLLPETGEPGALYIAERLREQTAKLELPGERGPVIFTVSVGVALWRGEGDSLSDLLQRADAALYEAKNRGRNQVVMSESLA